MSVRTAVIAIGVILAGLAYMLRGGGPGASARPGEAPPAAIPAPPRETPDAMPSARNVFEYGDRPAAVVVPRPRAPVTTPEAAPSSAPAPAAVRLVGVVRRGGALRVALAVHGEVFVLARGESAEGYTVETIDEDGVSVREPGGTIVRLSAGE